jgi:hypothetical protein
MLRLPPGLSSSLKPGVCLYSGIGLTGASTYHPAGYVTLTRNLSAPTYQFQSLSLGPYTSVSITRDDGVTASLTNPDPDPLGIYDIGIMWVGRVVNVQPQCLLRGPDGQPLRIYDPPTGM